MRQSGFPCRFGGCERVFHVADQRSMEALHAGSAARTAHEIAEHGYHHQPAPEVRYVPPFLRSAAKNGGWRKPAGGEERRV